MTSRRCSSARPELPQGLLDLEGQCARPSDIRDSDPPRPISRLFHGRAASLDDGPVVSIAVIADESQRGDTLLVATIENQHQLPERQHGEVSRLMGRPQAPDRVHPAQYALQVADEEMKVICLHAVKLHLHLGLLVGCVFALSGFDRQLSERWSKLRLTND
jgi:hypothetical protein